MWSKQLILFALIGATTLAYPDPDAKASARSAEQPIVATPLGQIQGATLTSRLGKPISAFRGIRYGKAPVENLRFQAPVAADKWEGIYNATQDGPVCPQQTSDPTSEDCLLLNVYSTKIPKGNDHPKRAVIVYFHVGGFFHGSGASFAEGPQYLLDHDIVLVTLNYRLGTLGFLSTGDKEAPGNNGLKDQVLALKWVKNNIASFGGNPDSITIMGCSVGGVSVSLHLVSPLSKGLFHKAIIMSGSSFGQYPIPKNQMTLAKRQAKLVGCPDDNSANIVRCLKTKTAAELAETYSQLTEFGSDPIMIWSPVIEDDFGQERFLTAHPVHCLLNDDFVKVPVMSGLTTDEAGWKAFSVISNDTLKNELNTNFDKTAPIAFIYERDTDHSKTISKELKTFYLNDKPLDNSSLPGLSQLYADGLIGFGIHRTVKLLSEKNTDSIYYYLFNYKGRYSNYYLPNSNQTIPYGVVHLDDLIYLFYNKKQFPLFTDSDPEVQTVTKMTTMWTNFAKTGKPIPEPTDKLDNAKWEPYTGAAQKYLDIGNKLVQNEKLFEKRYAEWEKLFPVSLYKNKKHSG